MQRRLLRCLAVVRAIFRVSTKSQARESGTGQFEHYERESPLACPKVPAANAASTAEGNRVTRHCAVMKCWRCHRKTERAGINGDATF